MPLRKICLAVLLLTPFSAFAAFNPSVQWDVRTTGSDTNGGAFDPNVTAPGTDESMGASGTSVSCVIQATTTQAICTPAISSTTHGPGNFVGPMTGAGCTANQWIELLSQTSGTGTFDKALGTAGSTCVGTMGGSLLTLNKAGAIMVSYNTVHVQSGTYTVTAVITQAVGTENTWEGYGIAHWDMGTAPLITTSTAITNLFQSINLNVLFVNLSMSNTAAGANKAAAISVIGASGSATIYKCTLDGFTTAMSASSADMHSIFSEIKNSTVSTMGGPNVYVYGSWFHNNAVGITLNTPNAAFYDIENSYITDNTAQGLYLTAHFSRLYLINNVFANNGGAGVDIAGPNGASSSWAPETPYYGIIISNNVFYGNSGFGMTGFNTGNGPIIPSDPTKPMNAFMGALANNNAYGANSSGASLRWNDTGRITLTANPFVSSGTGNYAINTTAGGGALLSGLGWPSVMPGGIMSNYRDVGGVQHQATGGSGGNSGYTF